MVDQLDNNIVEWQRIRGVFFGWLYRAKSSSFARTPYIKEEGKNKLKIAVVREG